MTRRFIVFIFLFIFSFAHYNTFSQSSGYLTVTQVVNKEKFSSADTLKGALIISIKEGYHINSYEVNDPSLIKTTITSSDENFKMLSQFFPLDKKLKFEFSDNELNVYEGQITVGLTFITSKDIQNGKYEIPVKFNYQACDDKVCYPPASLTTILNVEIDGQYKSLSETNSEIFNKINFSSPSQIKSESIDPKNSLTENKRVDTPNEDEEQVSNWIEEKGLTVSLFLIFLGGLALNLTPCVYPLIPITVSFFGAQSSGSKSQSILMGLFYALGMSVTYSALGVFAALTGSLLGNALQNPIVIIAIALILFALGTSMFGLFEIRVPQSLALMGNKNRSGYFGSSLMGLTVGFIAAPCIGPFVLSLLVYVGKLGNPFTGFLLFFVLSMGLGLPYIFLAASSSSISKLPRSGEWMEGIKVIFGLILFGMVLNTLEPLIPKDIFILIFPLYIISAGVYLIILDKKGSSSFIYSKIKYLIAIAAIIFGTLMLKPQQTSEEVNWKVLSSLESINKSIAEENKPVMIDFYADWCAQCKELDEYTYTNPEIVELSSSLNNIKIDLTKENSEITDKFGIKGLPVVIFMNSKGEEYKELRVTGFLKPEDFKKKIISIQNHISQK
ncbi:MAG: protein-disulfide reductase DsbD [Ignavibacteria bacterium]